jgi:hypothetical protein
MKTLNNILLILLSLFIFSACEKNVVEYPAEKIDENNVAQFQIYYMVPIVTGAANNINMVELNGKLLTNQTTPLNTYNFIPSGAVSKFFTVTPGNVNLKLYRGPVTGLTLAYDQNFDLPAGRYSLVVHDFNQPPILMPHTIPLPSITTELTGTTAWIKFSNWLYETTGTPTTFKLQYQFQYVVDNQTGEKSQWANLGNPVAFGESTELVPVTINKTVEISAGTARIDYRIRMIGPDGSDQGSLIVRNSAGSMVEYSDWWNAQIGRVYHHNLAGFRTITPIASVRQFTIQ